MSPRRTLLIDADVFMHKFCHATALPYDTGFSIPAAIQESRCLLDAEIRYLLDELDADDARLAFSDTERNWRRGVLPSYKANRQDNVKPPGFKRLRAYAEEQYKAKWVPTLEADDVLGIWSTGKGIKGEKIVVSIDKDMGSFPGLWWNPQKPELGVQEITREAADRFHLMQTLMGDHVDGYTGIPGVGPKRAAAILDHTCSWSSVVAAYERRGLTAQDALVQAQVARILRVGEWGPRRGVTLWKPRPRFTVYHD